MDPFSVSSCSCRFHFRLHQSPSQSPSAGAPRGQWRPSRKMPFRQTPMQCYRQRPRSPCLRSHPRSRVPQVRHGTRQCCANGTLTLASAAMVSPSSRMRISPGTKSLASTSCSLPSRTTVHLSAMPALSCATISPACLAPVSTVISHSPASNTRLWSNRLTFPDTNQRRRS